MQKKSDILFILLII